MTPTRAIRLNETVHGRPYLIELLPISVGRWRAQIIRAPGGRTALMPFYGSTPDEAARSLTSWLDRVGSPKGAE